jgi:sulfur-carrier protein
MNVTVHLFSIAREMAGFEERTLTLNDNATIGSVFEFLVRSNPQFIDWKHTMRFAVNHEYVDEGYLLSDGDDVAVIPPVSGG